MNTRESVSTHSFWVCFYSMLIYDKLTPKDDKLVAPILMNALMHDFVESRTGDFVRTFKYSSSVLKTEIDKAEEAEKAKFPEEVQNLYSMGQASHLSDKDRILIHEIVKAADFLSLFSYMKRELIRGNGEVHPFYDIMVKDLYKMSGCSVITGTVSSFDKGMFFCHLAQEAESLRNVR